MSYFSKTQQGHELDANMCIDIPRAPNNLKIKGNQADLLTFVNQYYLNDLDIIVPLTHKVRHRLRIDKARMPNKDNFNIKGKQADRLTFVNQLHLK